MYTYLFALNRRCSYCRVKISGVKLWRELKSEEQKREEKKKREELEKKYFCMYFDVNLMFPIHFHQKKKI